ncbi:putative mediator of RNA polymerase II transcription subunit 29 [Saccostrea echinata]|uniref:putative mediator of RNA polymerase II transcription subunit 29 n=1 Tax=Saccostrea echinata TaxID=191078 RepID=UPI002A7EB7DE|nr:putative mediator of RNA polymerase II transcription subunit 29 [Saccostrea echinata]
MMASQFDSLLDFGDSSTGDSKSTSNQMTDDFDPFGSPSPLDAKGGSGMDLLGEFNFDTQFSSTRNTSSTNGHGEPVNSSSDLNPLYALSMQQDNMGDTEPVNPLYDVNSVPEVQKGDLMMSSGSSNPMYDFLSTEGTNGHTNSDDLLGLDSSNQGDLLGSEKNQVNGSVEMDAGVNKSEELDVFNENGRQSNDNIVDISGNMETTPVVDEFSPKNEAIEDLEQESGSLEQEGGSSTSGELLVDSDVTNTRLIPEDDLQGETTSAKESEDLLGGAMEPDVVEESKVEESKEEAVEQEEQPLDEVPTEEEPVMTENVDQSESLMDQGGPVSEELIGDFSQNAEVNEQEREPEEQQELVEVQQEEVVEEQTEEDTGPPQPEEPVDEPAPETFREPTPEKIEEPAVVEDVSQQFIQDEVVEADENMSSQTKDPLQSDSLVQPLVEELAITRSPSSSEGEIEQVKKFQCLN